MSSLPSDPVRPGAPLVIEFPESLPVSARRDEIAQAIAAHQVVIVCGETGSGKTTQLPKIALAMGRGKLNAPPGRGRLIGHTQPRRIAASSVAKRIAEKLSDYDAGILYRVMLIDIEVAGGVEREIESAVPSE